MTDSTAPQDDHLSDDMLDKVAGGDEVFDVDDPSRREFRPWQPSQP